MRLVLLSYFDLGTSYGLADDVYDADRLAPGYPIGMVGYQNPLGRGVRVDLAAAQPATVQTWRDIAEGQVDRPEFEIGFDAAGAGTRAEFVGRLKDTIRSHPCTRCDITVFAVGWRCCGWISRQACPWTS